MSHITLAINAGSSSLKTTLFFEDTIQQTLRRLASAEISAINQPPAKLKYKRGEYRDFSELDKITDHRSAFEHVLNAFISDELIPEVKSKTDIKYACHRVVQGGDFADDELLTRETFNKIQALSDLAPLYGHCGSPISPRVTNLVIVDTMPPR